MSTDLEVVLVELEEVLLGAVGDQVLGRNVRHHGVAVLHLKGNIQNLRACK